MVHLRFQILGVCLVKMLCVEKDRNAGASQRVLRISIWMNAEVVLIIVVVVNCGTGSNSVNVHFPMQSPLEATYKRA